MKNASRHVVPLILLSASLLAALPLSAQYDYENQEQVGQTVARLAYFTGQVSYNRGDDPDDWQPAAINFPMTLGDRIYTARDSRLELQLRGSAIFLGPETDLAALNLTRDVKQLSISAGSASFRIRGLDQDDSYEVDTPNAAVTFDRPGEYRVDVDRDGNTVVSVSRGAAYVSAAGGEVPLRTGDAMRIDGIDEPVYDVYALPRRDSFDFWVEQRARRYRTAATARYVSADVFGADDLDEYGRWEQIPEYGTCWSPSSVSVDWAPYRAGHWVWQDPWGWTWVSSEPWGWAPYHYGRWVTFRSRWFWVPVAASVRTAFYAPALVAFVGGGPDWSVSISFGGGGVVGWFPLAPRDPFVPWWGSRASARVNVTNVTYVNRTYVTVVNQNVFVSGGDVQRSYVREPGVVRQLGSVQVSRGPIPVMPERTSLRVTSSAVRGSAPRPPERLLTTAVVSRLAPPPAPPRFDVKAAVIRENRGAPVAPRAAAELSVERGGGARAAQPIRPVSAEGRVVFRPKEGRASVPAAAPVREAKGRALSTVERPIARDPSAVTSPDAQPAPRVAPGAVVAPRGRERAPEAGPATREVPPGQIRREERDAHERPETREAPRREAPQPETRQAPARPETREVPRPETREAQPRPETREAQPRPETREVPRPETREAPPGQQRREERAPRRIEAPTPAPQAAPPQPQQREERPSQSWRERESAPPAARPREEERPGRVAPQPQERVAPPAQERVAPPQERAAPAAPPRERTEPQGRAAPPERAAPQPQGEAPRRQAPKQERKAKEHPKGESKDKDKDKDKDKEPEKR